MNHKLVGFDVRLDKRDYLDSFWNKDDRERFLLKSDIEWPLSVDIMVWPSVFYSEIFREVSKLPYASIEVPPSTLEGQYWHNLARMNSYYADQKKSNSRGVPIALQIFHENGLHSEQLTLTFGDHTDPGVLPNGEFLGFDVADLSGISALSNCEYTREEKERLAPVWVPHLNDSGLLTTLEHAAEFRQVSDARVPDHSPFWVYGIWHLTD